MTTSRRIIRFGVFELDLAAGELHKNGLKLETQEPYRVPAMLVAHAPSNRLRIRYNFEIVMMRKCLLGIKRRAETATAPELPHLLSGSWYGVKP